MRVETTADPIAIAKLVELQAAKELDEILAARFVSRHIDAAQPQVRRGRASADVWPNVIHSAGDPDRWIVLSQYQEFPGRLSTDYIKCYVWNALSDQRQDFRGKVNDGILVGKPVH